MYESGPKNVWESCRSGGVPLAKAADVNPPIPNWTTPSTAIVDVAISKIRL
jgi:hypothetical protein